MSGWQRPGAAGSLAWVLACYAAATAAGAVTAVALDVPWAWALLLADVAATIVVFGFSALLRNSSMYDAYWSVAPPLLLAGGMAMVGATPRGWLLLGVVGAWAVRLTLNWYRGWPDLSHEDWRYVDLAQKTGRAWWLVSFSGIHMFPTLCVAAGLLPAVVALPSEAPLGPWDALGAAVVLLGTLLELVADEQARAFKRTAGPGDLCDVGLWAWSRHPNYLGEILVWVGVWLIGIGAAPAAWHWTGAGVLVMLALFLGVSIPMQEERAAGRRRGWAEYKARTSMLLLWPPRRPPQSGGA